MSHHRIYDHAELYEIAFDFDWEPASLDPMGDGGPWTEGIGMAETPGG